MCVSERVGWHLMRWETGSSQAEHLNSSKFIPLF
jgi:hypothetical protein